MSNPTRTAASTAPSPREVLITRVFDAPRELVFRAWTEREHLLRWYAPRGCTIEFRHLDARPGGTFQSCIRSPDGHACWVKGEYREVVPPARLVLTMVICDERGNTVPPSAVGMDPEWPGETVLTVTLDEQPGGRTKLTLEQTVSEALAKRTGAHPSWLEMFDRLAEELAVG